MEIFLDFHGVRVQISCDSEEVTSWLDFDFSWFKSEESPSPVDIRISAFFSNIPSDLIPEIEETTHSPTCVSYDSGNTRYVDCYGRATVVMDYLKEEARLYSDDPQFAYEKLYLLILSRVGEFLDRRGFHRVHALGVEWKKKAFLFLMPMRGGKSTLALSMLESYGVKLLSEDTPLISTDGHVHPFPLRLALREESAVPSDVSPHFLRRFERSQFGPKILISSDYFKEKICREKVPLCALFAGKWTRAKSPLIRPASRIRAIMSLFRDCVAGLGLPQVVEFFLSNPIRDLMTKSPIVARRAAASIRCAWKARCFEVLLSEDREANAKLLMEFLETKLS